MNKPTYYKMEYNIYLMQKMKMRIIQFNYIIFTCKRLNTDPVRSETEQRCPL